MTVTTVSGAAARLPVTSSWSDRCEARGDPRRRRYRGPRARHHRMLVLCFACRTTPPHPYDPATVKEIAT